MSEGELVIFADDTVRVTDRRIIIEANTYEVPQLQSVGIREVWPEGYAEQMGLLPYLSIFGSIMLLLYAISSSSLFPIQLQEWNVVFLILGMIGIGIFAVRMLQIRRRGIKPLPMITLFLASGDHISFALGNREYSDRVVVAINQALRK